MNYLEVLAKYSQPTIYERNNNITQKSAWTLLNDQADLKFYIAKKTDDTSTLLIIFRAGLTDNWCGWMITETQARIMIDDFPKLYTVLNKKNKVALNRRSLETFL